MQGRTMLRYRCASWHRHQSRIGQYELIENRTIAPINPAAMFVHPLRKSWKLSGALWRPDRADGAALSRPSRPAAAREFSDSLMAHDRVHRQPFPPAAHRDMPEHPMKFSADATLSAAFNLR